MNNPAGRKFLKALPALALLALAAPALAAGAQTFTLTSPAYKSGGTIPVRFTCTGAGISPPLAWSGAPEGTKSFAFILEDPDAPDPKAPKMTWIHWVLYDIPADVHALAEGDSGRLPPGTRAGENSWKHDNYGGPCPPIGRHRYVHVLYALDTVLPNLHHPDAQALEAAMQGHILARTTLIATYAK